MEFRPSLRRLYTTVTDLETYAPIVIPLAFAPVTEANVEIGGITYHTAVLDFGPSSVDGWLANLCEAELGIASPKAEDTVTECERLLVTVLFTDIVDSTERAAQLGDSRWRDLLESHHAIIREELSKFQGSEIDTAGDGFFATFGIPANGIKCACAIINSVRKLGIDIRAGLHLGECEKIGESVRGIGVHIGARVAAQAGAGEVLVSRTIADAMAGSDIKFKDRGTHLLKGIPGEWHLFTVE
jgi:class 3 adenylate cyclase